MDFGGNAIAAPSGHGGIMKKSHGIGLAVAAMLTLITAPAFAKTTFNTHLTGKDEVPTRETHATGQAMFTLSSDGTTLQYKINVSNIENVVSVRMGNAPVGETGPDVAVLFGPAAAGGGKVSGPLTTGSLTSASLVGPLAGRTIADLITEINAGRIYLNVVTDDGLAPTDQKPGDFISGEIRGQVE